MEKEQLGDSSKYLLFDRFGRLINDDRLFLHELILQMERVQTAQESNYFSNSDLHIWSMCSLPSFHKYEHPESFVIR